MSTAPPAADPVDEWIAESFPASDPPPWWQGGRGPEAALAGERSGPG